MGLIPSSQTLTCTTPAASATGGAASGPAAGFGCFEGRGTSQPYRACPYAVAGTTHFLMVPNAAITDTKVIATDGSSVRTTTIVNAATHAQDRQDIVTTSADGRTTTLQSARDGDTTIRYTETTVVKPNGTISDASQFTSGTAAPSYSQSRSQTLDTTGGQTVAISNYDATGGLEDKTSTTVSGNGLSTQSVLDTTGDPDPHRRHCDQRRRVQDGDGLQDPVTRLGGAPRTRPGL